MGRANFPASKIANLRLQLLAWYQASHRDLPWRRTRDPYRIWVSEIMLQQTRVVAVLDRYRAFIERFPTLTALATAREDEVLALWSGLGYYRRARMLHRAAQQVAAELDGQMPRTAAELRRLPGIGAYTSAAIASIAFDEPVAAVDGNVERVLCRVAGWDAAADGIDGRIRRLADELANPELPGDWNQAMMELGATVCSPRSPQCSLCPIREACKTRGEHPTAPRQKMRSQQIGQALVLRFGPEPGPAHRQVLLEQRGRQETVMAGMWELPALGDLDIPDEDLRFTLRHAIMQVNYTVRIRVVEPGDVAHLTRRGGRRHWVPIAEAAALPLTGLARKALHRARLIP
jgi:A/G-specific adenine glycosylase